MRTAREAKAQKLERKLYFILGSIAELKYRENWRYLARRQIGLLDWMDNQGMKIPDEGGMILLVLDPGGKGTRPFM